MENRNHKDSLFIDLFCKDKDGKQNFISLYNALHNTNLDLSTIKYGIGMQLPVYLYLAKNNNKLKNNIFLGGIEKWQE